MKFRLTFAIALTLPLALALSGCGDDSGLAKRYPVSGKVTYKGAPVEKGFISFISGDPNGRGGTGMITNGEYKLTTQDPGDGAFPGAYSVTVSSRIPDLAKADSDAKKKGNTAGYIPQDFTAKANKEAKNTIPDKYSVPTTSPLKAEVKAGSNTFDFDLVD